MFTKWFMQHQQLLLPSLLTPWLCSPGWKIIPAPWESHFMKPSRKNVQAVMRQPQQRNKKKEQKQICTTCAITIIEKSFIRTGAGLTAQQTLSFEIRKSDDLWLLMTKHRVKNWSDVLPHCFKGVHWDFGSLSLSWMENCSAAIFPPSAKLEILDTWKKSVMGINKLSQDKTPIN